MPRTVLVVDDEAMVRMPICEYLRDCGFTVLEAGDAAEAIDAIDHSHVDLVFSDIRMPGSLDGVGLAHWVRAHHPDIHVILTSGYDGGRGGKRDVEVRFIEKPYSQAAVVRRIEAMLQP